MKLALNILSFCIAVTLLVVVASCNGHKKIEVSATSVASAQPSKNPCLKVFIENSGSMDGYMCEGSQLKDVIYDYVSDINRVSQKTELYYINSVLIPYKGNLTNYIKDLNPEVFKKAGGNRSSTDLGDLIANVLKEVDDTNVCIFVSDCILDLPAKNAQKFLSNCQIRIKDEVINAQKRVPNLGVEILKLSSDFDGKYFYPNGMVENLKDVKRPYYIWIFGNKNNLSKLNAEVPFSQLAKYGLSDIVTFANQSNVPFDIFNNALTSKNVMPAEDGYHIVIQADFRATLQPNGVIQDKNNYSFHNSTIVVDGIYPITDPKSKYTHFIKFTIPRGTHVIEDCLTFNTPKMPLWISESNDDTGTNIQKNIKKTTGIKYLIHGVADAYKNEKVCATFNFNVKYN